MSAAAARASQRLVPTIWLPSPADVRALGLQFVVQPGHR